MQPWKYIYIYIGKNEKGGFDGQNAADKYVYMYELCMARKRRKRLNDVQRAMWQIQNLIKGCKKSKS